MTTDQIRDWHQARPFQPFDIHMADGLSLSVEHPECLAISKGGRTIGVAVEENVIETVDLLLVTSLKPRSNGPTGRRRKS